MAKTKVKSAGPKAAQKNTHQAAKHPSTKTKPRSTPHNGKSAKHDKQATTEHSIPPAKPPPATKAASTAHAVKALLAENLAKAARFSKGSKGSDKPGADSNGKSHGGPQNEDVIRALQESGAISELKSQSGVDLTEKIKELI